MLGVRGDPTPGLAHRVVWFEYDDRVDPVLLFRLFSPEGPCEAARAAGWSVSDCQRPHGSYCYRIALEKA